MKKKILFNISNIHHWVGGIYYAKNIISLIKHSELLSARYEIHLLCDSHEEQELCGFMDDIHVQVVNYSNDYIKSMYAIWYMNKNCIDYWYALSINIIDRLMITKAIMWIPDFQYMRLPDLFSVTQIKRKHELVKFLAKQNRPLIFSSYDSKKDFEEFYKSYKCQCFVVHFTSNIVELLKSIDGEFEEYVLKKYNLQKGEYVYIPNQFWQHKNHIVVVKMIQKYVQQNIGQLKFVFTGEFFDYRNTDYISELEEYFGASEIREYITNLGYLQRKEQLVIMRHSRFLIQPSLFEGWGTVLEDAKVLDKSVILSDLDVHKEQMYEKCILFKKNDVDDLLNKVKILLNEVVEDNVDVGIRRFHEDSQKYAKELEKILL